MKRGIVFITILVMVCAIGVSVEQASGEPAGPPDGLAVNIVDQPLDVVVTNPQTTTKAQQDGTWNVGITNNVENPVPVEVIQYPREPFFRRMTGHLGIDEGAFKQYFYKPEDYENKLLVIESISVEYWGDSPRYLEGTVPYYVSVDMDNVGGYFFSLPMTKQTTMNFVQLPGKEPWKRDIYIGAHSFRLYATDNAAITLTRTNDWYTEADVDVLVSGYTIPKGSPSLAP